MWVGSAEGRVLHVSLSHQETHNLAVVFLNTTFCKKLFPNPRRFLQFVMILVKLFPGTTLFGCRRSVLPWVSTRLGIHVLGRIGLNIIALRAILNWQCIKVS